ncbi:DNA repair protein RadC [Lachnospiraceae bacterium 62-35]
MGSKTMKQLPKEDRPYEKCLRLGAEGLSDEELLAIIIRNGSHGENSLELSKRVLQASSPREGLVGLMHLSLADLTSMKGIGQVKGIQLLCIGELSRRIWKRRLLEKGLSFHSPEEIAEYCMEDMRHREQEELIMMCFNTKQILVKEVLLSKGTVSASVITSREVFAEALKCGAVNIVLIHNHPSGNPSPSREDLAFTENTKKAGDLIGIRLIDHIIIGDHTYISLKEQGVL